MKDNLHKIHQVHWGDFPKDDLSKILGYDSKQIKALTQLSNDYHQISKVQAEKFIIRANKLFLIAAYLENWIVKEIDSNKDKIKHLELLKSSAIKKANYLTKLIEQIFSLSDVWDHVVQYHIPKIDKDENLLYLNNQRIYSLKKMEYWGDFWITSLDPCHRQLTPYLISWENISGFNIQNNTTDFFQWLESLEIPNYTPTEEYFSLTELNTKEIKISKQGNLIDINENNVSFEDKNKKYLYILDSNSKIYISEETPSVFHASFTRGKPISSAGKIRVSKGKITSISFESGHYFPSLKSGFRFLKLLLSKGYQHDIDNNLQIEFFYDRNKYSINSNIKVLDNYDLFENYLMTNLNKASKCSN